MNIDKTGPDLALYLARRLTDLEFELLVRNRIKLRFEYAHVNNVFSESHNSCRFDYAWNDKSQWHVHLGSCYNDCVSIQGEVLSHTVENCVTQWHLQNSNKLSLLLPAPEPTPADPDSPLSGFAEDKRW